MTTAATTTTTTTTTTANINSYSIPSVFFKRMSKEFHQHFTRSFYLRRLRPCIPIDLFWFNRLIASIFAYFICENNHCNHFVKPYQNCGWLAKLANFLTSFLTSFNCYFC